MTDHRMYNTSTCVEPPNDSIFASTHISHGRRLTRWTLERQ